MIRQEEIKSFLKPNKNENGTQIPKRKTAHIIEKLSSEEYRRKPQEEIMLSTKQETKTLIIARFGMLECGRNFKGSMNEMCTYCDSPDDENHRLNHCIKYRTLNNYDSDVKLPFENVFSNDISILREIISKIETVWNTRCAHGTMNK